MSKIAIVFPGQGAQYSGMGKDLYLSSKAAKAVFDAAEDLRKGTLEQCFNADKEELSKTINTQPCMFAVSVAHAAALKEQGQRADAVAGFSVGELAALCVAEVLTLESAFNAVCKRAQLMHSAAQNGKGVMAAALRLPGDKIKELCQKAGVFAVNFNCPSQTVVAGKEELMADFYKLVAESGGRTLPLAVSGAFHSPMMDGAAKEFKQYLTAVKFNKPVIPVYANITAQPYGDCEEENKNLLSGQINNPVLWQDVVENMLTDGITEFIETQPGTVLTGLIAKIKTK